MTQETEGSLAAKRKMDADGKREFLAAKRHKKRKRVNRILA